MRRAGETLRVTARALAVLLPIVLGLGWWGLRRHWVLPTATRCEDALSLKAVDFCSEDGRAAWLSPSGVDTWHGDVDAMPSTDPQGLPSGSTQRTRQVTSPDGTLTIHFDAYRNTYRLTCAGGHTLDLFTAWDSPGCDEGDACVMWTQDNNAIIVLQKEVVMFREARLSRLCSTSTSGGP
jgi:hypothetical protein